MNTPQTPADVLDAAADHIDAHGWTQNVLREGEKCCAVGALMEVTGGSALETQTEIILRHRLSESIARWNDKPSQSAANVTRTMRAVAASLRGDA